MDTEHRKALFDWMTLHGVVQIVAEFDGSGDDGQVNSVTCWGASGNSLGIDLTAHKHPLAGESLEEFIIDAVHGEFTGQWDWVNNDGGYGTVTFNLLGADDPQVAQFKRETDGGVIGEDWGPRSVHVDINIRVVSSENHTAVF